MKTIVLERPGEFRAADTPDPPAPGPGQALVRVRRIGVCGTDLHAYRGRQPFFTYPRILGHELGVEVLAVAGDVLGVKSGDRCAVEPYLYCGACVACRRGRTNCCARLAVLGVHVDGGMRETIVVPAANLHPSSRLSLEQLALVETFGIGAHAVARAGLTSDDRVLVIGAGPIGLSAIQFALLEGVPVTVLDQNPRRLEFCRGQFDVDPVLADAPDMSSTLAARRGGELPTVVFDATGSPASMERAFSYVANTGKLVLAGLFPGDVKFHDPEFHRREMTLLATRNSTSREFRAIIDLLERGKIDATPWITHTAPFGETIARFESWLAPESGVVKAMISLD